MRCGTLRKPIFVALLILLFSMDICLYLRIQSFANEEVQFGSKEANVNSKQRQVVSIRKQQKQQQPSNISHGASASFNWLLSLASKFSYAFNGMSIKLMMTDPIDNYFMGPLSELFASLCNFKQRFHFISANMVSYSGVISALVAAKLVTHNSPSLHKLSVLFFQLRTWLDDLDGVVARSRMGITKHVSLTSTPGYIIDGVCDAIGFAAYTIGCYIYLRNNIISRSSPGGSPGGRSSSAPGDKLQSADFSRSATDKQIPLKQGQEHHERDKADNIIGCETTNKLDSAVKELDDCSVEGSRFGVTLREDIRDETPAQVNVINNRQLVVAVSCFLLQLTICSTLWNRYILVYRDLLESPSTKIIQARAKRQILKSNVMFALIWFWRLTNGHSMMQMLAASIFVGKLWQFLNFIKYLGFIEILSLAALTELHITDVRNYLNDLAS